MPLTMQQFEELRSKGLTTEQISRFESGNRPEARSDDGFFTTMAKTAIEPFARAGVTAYKAAAGAGHLAEAGVQRALGNEEKSREVVQKGLDITAPKPADLPFVGPTAGFGASEEGEFLKGADRARDIVGGGAELASYAIGAPVVKNITQMTFREGIRAIFSGGLRPTLQRAFLQGGIPGALGAGGHTAQRTRDPGEIAAATALGAAAGTVAAPVLGVAGAGAGAAFRAGRGTVQGTRQAITTGRQAVRQPVETARALTTKVREAEGFTGRLAREGERFLSEKFERMKRAPEIRQAANLGIPEPTIKFVTENMSPKDKTIGRFMIMEAQRAAERRIPENPLERTVGQTILKRIRHNEKVVKVADRELGTVVKEMGKTPVPTTQAVAQFGQRMDELGIVVEEVDEKSILNFDNSPFRGAFQSEDRRILQHIWNQLNPGAKGNQQAAWDIHTLRQSLFSDLDLAKPDRVLTEQVEFITDEVRKNLRASIMSSQGKLGQKYGEITETSRITKDMLRGFFKLIGERYRKDPDKVLSLRAGEVYRRILGRAAAEVEKRFTLLEEVSARNGFKSTENPLHQAVFASIIEEIVPQLRPQGFAGQVTAGVTESLKKAGIATLTGHPLATKAATMQAARSALGIVKGKTWREQIRALDKLLQLGSGPK